MHCSNGVEYIVNRFFLLGKESIRRVEMNFRKRPAIGGLEEREMATLIRCRQVDQEIQHASSGLLPL